MTLAGIIAESIADARRVTGLADRVILDQVDWITPDVIDAYRLWCGVEGEDFLDLHGAFTRARERGLKVYGHFDGQPCAEDAATTRAALLLFAEEDVDLAAVVLARDVDNRPARVDGFHQAIRVLAWPFAVISALATPEIEAWRIAACETESPAEEVAHQDVRQRIGFDPTLHPERLTSKNPTDKADAKRVLRELTAGGRDPDERWADAPLSRLRERGAACGLADFISGVEMHILPHLAAVQRSEQPAQADRRRP